MKIAHLSTFWPIGTGLSLYTDLLISGMRVHRPERHTILAEIGSAPAQTEAYECIPCYRRNEDYVESIAAAAATARPDVLIVQYAPDLFGHDNRLPRLLARLRELGVRPVVNMHSVYPENWRSGFRPGRSAAAFDRAVAENAALITVHSPRMKHDLITRGVAPDRIAVVPHGSRILSEGDGTASRAQLQIPRGAKVILFFGFLWLGKGIEFLLDVFRGVQRQVPEAFLLVGGHTRHRRWSFYVATLRARAALLGISGRCRFWGGFIPQDLVPTVYATADVVAMPYRQDYSSVSGVMHETAGMGKLMVCSRIAKFDEVETNIDRGLTADPNDRGAWIQAMVRLLRDEEWARQMKEKIRRFAEQTSWEKVGKMHGDLYQGLIGGS
ncbi:MAG TPA: glycosyltransferase [Polyangia bacterium]|jgi:Glycosyltransferase|nr:glycosyltransferase [Polyangia bacterium]